MDVMIKDYNYETEYNNVLDLVFYLQQPLWEVMQSVLPKDVLENFKEKRRGDFLAPDGNFAFEPTGIMNIYVQGLIPNEYLKTLTDAAIYLLGEIDVKANLKTMETFSETIEELDDQYMSPLEIEQEQERYTKSLQEKNIDLNSTRVIRLEITENPNPEKETNEPPKVNLSNRNMYHLMTEMMNFDLNRPLDAWQVVQRIEQTLPLADKHQIEDEVSQEKGKAQFFGFGIDTEYIKRTLSRIKEVAQWAIDNGYQQLYVV